MSISISVTLDKSYTYDNFLLSFTMFTMNKIIIFCSLILKVMSENLPPAFALDIGNGEGIKLLYRVRKDDTNCRFYQSTDADNSLMMYKDGDYWVIKLDSGATRAPPLNNINKCNKMVENVNSAERYILQFTLPSTEQPTRGGWIDAQDDTRTPTTLDLYKLEECTSYTHVRSIGPVSTNFDAGNFEDCIELAAKAVIDRIVDDRKKTFLVTTGKRIKPFYCEYAELEGLDGKDVTLESSDDDGERITILSHSCHGGISPDKIVRFDGNDATDADYSTELEIGLGVGGGVVLIIVIIAVVMCLKWKRTRDKRVTVDSNMEYGDQEYYDLHDTNVVDSNEAYNDYYDYGQ